MLHKNINTLISENRTLVNPIDAANAMEDIVKYCEPDLSWFYVFQVILVYQA